MKRILRHTKPHLLRLLVLCAWSAQGTAAWANPMDPLNATRGEIARLPDYCNHVWGYFRDSQERANWFARMGPVFEHMHHYCWAMVKANRAQAPGIDPQLRRSLYASAVDECRYVLRNYPDPAFVLRPEIFYRMGQFEAANEAWIQAIEYHQQSILSKPDYWPPYVGLADIHLRLGRPDRALDVLNEGLKLMPDEPRLQAAVKRATERQAGAAGRSARGGGTR